MGYMTINNRRVAFTDEKNVLSVIRKSGIDLPTFCYHSELSTYGACRMCVVEDERGKVFASCSEVPRDGMVIYTNTPRLQHHRKMIIELLLSSHCRDCTTCAKNGVCTLQKLASQLGISEIRFENHKKPLPLDTSSDCVIRDPNKCILCGDCVRTCDEIQGLGILDFAFRGSKMQVMPAFNRELAETDCVGCGQCRAVCPTGAISIRQDVDPVWKALADKNIRVVAQIAPAVRVAIGDKFGIPKGENTLGRLVAALRHMGFDEVYDTNFGADLTVMEESAELLERLKSGKNLPLFTSCCPGWVKFCAICSPGFWEKFSPLPFSAGNVRSIAEGRSPDESGRSGKRRTKPPQDGCDLDYAMYGKKSRDQKTGAFYRRAAGCRLCTDHDRSDPYDQRSGNRSVADRTGGTGYAVWSVFGGSSDLWSNGWCDRGSSETSGTQQQDGRSAGHQLYGNPRD